MGMHEGNRGDAIKMENCRGLKNIALSNGKKMIVSWNTQKGGTL
jgi:hypothetical protein